MILPIFDISGAVALVTGSSRGIGLALATGLVDAGCTVVLNGRDPYRLESARMHLDHRAHEVSKASGVSAAPVVGASFDVTDPAAVRAGIAQIEADLGGIDILVNNTGAQHRAPFTEFPDDVWNDLLATNLTSAFLVGREVSRAMVGRGRGSIVNVCSLQSEVTRPGITPYAATKGALKMLTKGMCADLAGQGIRVNAIGPGYFATELTEALVADEAFSDWVRGRTPAGRWGAVEELVGARVFLVSPAASFVHGHILYVDGGMSCVL